MNVTDPDPELEGIKRRMLELEAEEIDHIAGSGSSSGSASATDQGKQQAGTGAMGNLDGRSIYVGNVDYSSRPEELQGLFSACGTVLRITILCDKFSGHPKGYAYVEFAEQNRPLKIAPKRTNIPGVTQPRRVRVVNPYVAYASATAAGGSPMGISPPRRPYNSYGPRHRMRVRRTYAPY